MKTERSRVSWEVVAYRSGSLSGENILLLADSKRDAVKIGVNYVAQQPQKADAFYIRRVESFFVSGFSK